MNNNDFLDILTNRRSIRKYKDVKIAQDDILEMLNLAVKSPSSRNIQPWEFVVVESPQAKEKLTQMVYSNTEQVKTSSFALIIFSRFQLENNAEKVVHAEYLKGHVPEEKKSERIEYFHKNYKMLSDEIKRELATFDAGIITANFLNVARHYGYDTNVIGGFVASEVHDEFSPASDTRPAIIITVGIADEEGKKTSRVAAEEITRFV
ncbi:nitroreductase family protein [Streptococcaceae bacterium ESL0687]|nr:nitroreductase family protein [Streptococcaceae bacterium ESL0687]